MIYKLARYYYFKLHGTKYLDFVNQGLGIEARSSRFKRYWQPHLNACKEFQLAAIKNSLDLNLAANGCLSILGAGRLLDVPCQEFSEIFSKIRLVDADPACKNVWRKFQAKSKSSIDFELVDITSRLESWSSQLKNYLETNRDSPDRKDSAKLVKFLNSLSTQKIIKKWECPRSDVLISLNILSQLGIYWRDRVVALINKLAPEQFSADAQLLPEIESALLASVSVLETEHLELLSNSGAKLIIMLYDDEYYYYTNNQSLWQTEPALALQSEPLVSGYDKVASKCWLWHLVPEGGENKEYGEIHRVQGISLRRS